MVLKEAFRMQNQLTKLIQEAEGYLKNTNFVTKTTENHLRSKANPNAKDETIEVKKSVNTDFVRGISAPLPRFEPVQGSVDYEVGKVIALLEDLLKEKEILSKAISKAKRDDSDDIDMLVAINKGKQSSLYTFLTLANMKGFEKTTQGRGYMINAEGNQTPYTYDIESVTKIDFDRDVVRGIVKRLQREIDETSNKIDLANITIEVDYVPKYEIGDTFDEAYHRI